MKRQTFWDRYPTFWERIIKYVGIISKPDLISNLNMLLFKFQEIRLWRSRD